VLSAGCHNPQTELQLGNRAYFDGQPAQALGHYQVALQSPETRAAASYNLGRLYLAQGDPGQALKSLELAQGPDLNLLRSQAFRLQGQFEQARASLGDAVEPAEVLERARIEIGASSGLPPEDILGMLEVARQDPALSEVATSEIIHLMEASGQIEEAVAELEKLSASHPHRLDIDHRLASNLLKLKRFAEAESRFRRSLQRDPSVLPAYVGLGRALEGLGRTEDALQVYQALVSRLPPDNETSREARRRLEALQQ
jgi:tetratricopeptide (TPR) repeat protein